jgi:hypothetical protein
METRKDEKTTMQRVDSGLAARTVAYLVAYGLCCSRLRCDTFVALLVTARERPVAAGGMLVFPAML